MEDFNNEFSSSESDAVGSQDSASDTSVDRNSITASVFETKSLLQRKFVFAIAVFKWAVFIIVLNLVIFWFEAFVIQYTIVSGASMEHTLHDHDVLLVDKFSYGFTEPKRFDVIVFTPDESNQKQLYVKRVIGLPGETVQIIGNTIFINDKALDEDYGNSMITYQGIAAIPVTLGDDEYFVLGDNRLLSMDSRHSEIGSVSKSQVKGKVFFRLKPEAQIGFIK